MKLAVQITSWFSLLIGVIAFVEGLATTSTDPNGVYSIIGGLMFGVEGLLAILYVHQNG